MPAVVFVYAVVFGAAIRLLYVLAADFPLHDGGLFYAMTEDLRQNGYHLPLVTSYNAADLPFAYPPLAFYLAGLIADRTAAPLSEVFRFLPAGVSILTIGAFFLLARALLCSDLAAAMATAVFAMLPGSFEWQIMGGGVTRSLGGLFAILALWQAHALYHSRGARPVCLASLFTAAAILSHPEMGWFTIWSSALFFAAYGRSRAGVARAGLVALGTCIFTSPWWLVVLPRYGVAPFVAAGDSARTWQSLLLLASLNITGEGFFPVLGALALAGLLWCLVARRYLLPVWVVVTFVLLPRSALSIVTIPLALLGGIGITEVLLPLLLRSTGDKPMGTGPERLAPAVSAVATARMPLASALLMLLLLQVVLAAAVSHHGPLTALGAPEREAMAWIAEHTPATSTFLVVTGDGWSADLSSEWFPALARRNSVATVQGYEWAGNEVLRVRAARVPAIQRCAYRGTRCVEEWSTENGVGFTHVYVAKRPPLHLVADVPFDDCCWSLRQSLNADPGYEAIYNGPGAALYRRLDPAGSGS